MKKYFIFVLISFLFIGVLDVKASNPLRGKIIVVDPGHGGLDPGTMYKDIYEKDINLKIGIFLKEELEKKGAKVIMTRSGDYDLSKPNALYRKKSDFDNRIKIINDNGDFYLSVHLNYLEEEQYQGIQVFSTKKNFALAKVVQSYLNNKLKSNRENKLISNNIYMYQRLAKPGLLIECGFLSNAEERKKLLTVEYQQHLAMIVANAISKIEM